MAEQIVFQEVVKFYRRGKSYRAFADYLKEDFSNVTLSGQTIWRWENTPNAAPDLYFLLNCITTYTDLRASFAVDSLKAVMPHVFDSGMVTFNLPKTRDI